jgi:DnaJ-class molecular chaperone
MAEQEWLEHDYYRVLGLSTTATGKEITKAYRKLVKQLHPDTNPGSEEQFKEVANAYEVLGDASTRKEYDQLRTAATNHSRPTNTAGFANTAGFDFPGEFGDINDIFTNIFSRSSPRPQKGHDLEATLNISFRDAILGLTTTLTLSEPGRSSIPREVSVRIPPGIKNDQRIKLRAKGSPGAPGTQPGDLYITVSVDSDPVFTRQDNDLVTHVSVPFTGALLGVSTGVPTLSAPVTMKIPAGTQPGSVLRVKGRGVPAGTARSPGDLLVVVDVTLPKKLSDEQKRLVAQLESSLYDRTT